MNRRQARPRARRISADAGAAAGKGRLEPGPVPGGRGSRARPRGAAARTPPPSPPMPSPPWPPFPISNANHLPVSSRTRFIGAVEIGTCQDHRPRRRIHRPRARHHRLRRMPVARRHQGHRRRLQGGERVHPQRARGGRARAPASTIDYVFLAQTGGHLEGFYNEAAVNVKAADNMVSRLDIDTVCGLAKAKELPAGRMVVHNIRRPFRVDGRAGAGPRAPRRASGSRSATGPCTARRASWPTTST